MMLISFRNIINTFKILKKKNIGFSTLNSIMSEMKTSKKKKFKAGECISNPSMIIPNVAHFQVIGNGSRGAPKCVHLFTSSFRYLFNVGEGSQRLVIEHGCKLVKLSGIFVTHSSWDNLGGLPGIMLCLRDNNVNKVTLHGPPKVENLFIMTKGFMETQMIDIEKYDYHLKSYDDGCLKIEYIPISCNQSSKNDIEFDTEYLSSSSLESFGSTNDTSKNKKKTYKSSDRDTVICYIGQLHDRLGTLDLERCLLAGVPANSTMLGKLKNGQDITLNDGIIVKSSDVKSPDEPGLRFAIVECPSTLYLDNFIRNAQFQKYFNCHHTLSENGNKFDETRLSLIVHFTPLEIAKLPEYQSWMGKFGPHTKHWMINEITNGNVAFTDALRFQSQINQIDGDAFPLRFTPPYPQITRHLNHHIGSVFNNDLKVVPGYTLSKFQLRPLASSGFNFEDCRQPLEKEETPVQNAQSQSEPALPHYLTAEIIKVDKIKFANTLNEYNSKKSAFLTPRALNRSEISSISSDSYPNFVFLGTGSAIPNKLRNVSSIWVNLSPDSAILLDCGEGTAGQVIRYYGSYMSDYMSNLTELPYCDEIYLNRDQRPQDITMIPYDNDNVDRMLLKLKAIFISHLHADHHLGVIQILDERRKALRKKLRYSSLNDSNIGEFVKLPDDEKIALIAPKNLLHFLTPYHWKHGKILDLIDFFPSHTLDSRYFEEDIYGKVCRHLNLSDIAVFPVYHFKNPSGLTFTTNYGTEETFCNPRDPSLPSLRRKIVYSGDTLPCDSLLKHGANADLLIHESTFEDELQAEAFAKRHSTMGQAINIGERLNARHIVLTHFSQRYSKVPKFLNDSVSQNLENGSAATNIDGIMGDFVTPKRLFNPDTLSKVTYAFDNMKIDFDTLPYLPNLTEPMKVYFATELVEMEDRTFRHIRKMQLAAD